MKCRALVLVIEELKDHWGNKKLVARNLEQLRNGTSDAYFYGLQILSLLVNVQY